MGERQKSISVTEAPYVATEQSSCLLCGNNCRQTVYGLAGEFCACKMCLAELTNVLLARRALTNT